MAQILEWDRLKAGEPEGEAELEVAAYGERQARPSPEWAKRAIVYEIFPRVFSPEGTLRAVTARLEEIADLGVNTIWLMPIHPIGRKGRKGTAGSPYAVRNHLELHPQLGTKQDLRELVEEAHRLGLRVLLDFVASHCATDHVELARHPDWCVRDERGDPVSRVRSWTDVVDLDLTNREVREYLWSALLYWVREFDVDGYRCDVAGRAPLDFWEEARDRLERVKPDVFLLAEWSNPALHLKAFDATYDWRFYWSLLDVRRGKLAASEMLDGLVTRARRYPKGALRFRFLENHDEKRAAEAFGLDALEPYATALFTVGGIPMLYNGQVEGDTERPSLFQKCTIRQEPLQPFIPRLYRKLIAMRNENPVFAQGGLIPLENSVPRRVLSYARLSQTGAALVVLNLHNHKTDVRVQLPEAMRKGRENWMFADLGWQKLRIFRKPELFFELEPYESVVFVGEPE